MRFFIIFYLATTACLSCNCTSQVQQSADNPKDPTAKLSERFTTIKAKANKDYSQWIEEYQLIFTANINKLVALNKIMDKINDAEKMLEAKAADTVPAGHQPYIDWLQGFLNAARKDVSSMIEVTIDRGFKTNHELIMDKMCQKHKLSDGETFHILLEIKELRVKTKTSTKLIQEVPPKYDIIRKYLDNPLAQNDLEPIFNNLHTSLFESQNAMEKCDVIYDKFFKTFEKIFDENNKDKTLPELKDIVLEKPENTQEFDKIMTQKFAYYYESDPSRLVLNTFKASHDKDLNVLTQIGNNLTKINAMEAFKSITPYKSTSGDHIQYPDQEFLTMIYERRNALFKSYEILYKAFKLVCFNAYFNDFKRLVNEKLIGPGKCPPINMYNIGTIDDNVSMRNEYHEKILVALNEIGDLKELDNLYSGIRTKVATFKYNKKSFKKDITELETATSRLLCANDNKVRRIDSLARYIRYKYMPVVETHLAIISRDFETPPAPRRGMPLRNKKE